MAWAVITEGERIFQSGIVLVKYENSGHHIYVWYLQYWALCGGFSNWEQWPSTCLFLYT